MQLFRQQAIEYQHRLYGEVLLVPPLRWSLIIALLLILLAATALFLTWGSYSRTVAVPGVSLPAGRVELQVPASTIALVTVGQSVRILPSTPSRQAEPLLHGVIEHIGAVSIGTDPTNAAPLPVPVTARLTPLASHAAAGALVPGTPIDARIVLAARSLLHQIAAPEGSETTR